MSAITSCPRCSARVTVPESAPSESRVRCPLCGGEYRLQEAIEYVPPELVLIDEPSGDESRGAGWMAAASIADTMQTEATSGTTVAPKMESAEEAETIEFDDSLLMDETSTDIDLDTEDTSGSGAMIGSSKAADGEEFFDNLVSDESQASPAESLEEDDFRLAPPEERPSFSAAEDVSDGATAVATATRQKTRKSHPLLMLVGVVGGGLSGIVLGYAILMWAFGKDPAGIAKSLPDFLVPSSLQRSTTVAQSNQQPPNNQGSENTAFPPFGGESADSGDDSVLPAVDGDAGKAAENDPFGVAGTDTAKAGSADPLAKEDEAKSDPFGAIDDPSMKKSDPFGAVDDPLTKKADEEKGSERPSTPDPFDSLTAPSVPNKSDISDPFGAPPAITTPAKADETPTEPAKSGETKSEPDKNDESKTDQQDKGEAPRAQSTTSRYPTELGVVGPSVEQRATDADVQKAIETAKESTAAALALPPDVSQADKNRVNGPHFVNLTKVADAITTLELQPNQDAIGNESAEQVRKAVEAAVLEAVPTQTKFDELGKLSGYFYTSSAAKAGIVIAGAVKETKQLGEVFESVVETPGNKVSVTIVSPMKLTDESDRQVVVMGRIVDDPVSIRGYEGSAKRPVWSVFAVEPKLAGER